MRKKLLFILLIAASACANVKSKKPEQDIFGNYSSVMRIIKDHIGDRGRRERVKKFISIKQEAVTQEQWEQFKEDFVIADLGRDPNLLLRAIENVRVDVLDYWRELQLDVNTIYENMVTEKPKALFHHLIQEGYLSTDDQEKLNFFAELFPDKLDDTDKDGNTLLHIAVKKYNEQFLAWLIQNGVTQEIENVETKTAWDLLHEQYKTCSVQQEDADLRKQAEQLLQCKKIGRLIMTYAMWAGRQQYALVEKNINHHKQQKKAALEEKQKHMQAQKEMLENELKKLQDSAQEMQEETETQLYELEKQLKECEELQSNDFN